MKLIRIKSGDQIRSELIKKYVKGKSFADIGCMWRVNGYFSFLAEEYGAKKVIAVDINPPSEKFITRKNTTNSRIEFIKGDINSQKVINTIGSVDVVFCSGVLYHNPNPLFFLTNLKTICKEILILASVTIPEIGGLRNTAIFYPFLDKKQRNIWNLGVEQKGISEPYKSEYSYANWFWGLSPSCIESMLKYVGFQILERYIRPFQVFFVCQPI